jgi:hypothetical protein
VRTGSYLAPTPLSLELIDALSDCRVQLAELDDTAAFSELSSDEVDVVLAACGQLVEHLEFSDIVEPEQAAIACAVHRGVRDILVLVDELLDRV